MIRDLKKFVGPKADEELEIQKYKQLLKSLPSPSPDLHMKIGRLYEKLHQKDAAIAEYETATRYYTETERTVGILVASKLIARLNPEHHDALANIAFIELQQGIKLTEEEFAEFLQNLGQPLQHPQKKEVTSDAVPTDSATPVKSRLALSRKSVRAKAESTDPTFQARRQSLIDLIEGHPEAEESGDVSFDFARQSLADAIEREITEERISQNIESREGQKASEHEADPDIPLIDVTQTESPDTDALSRNEGPENPSLDKKDDTPVQCLDEIIPRLQECPLLMEISRSELEHVISQASIQKCAAHSSIGLPADRQQSLYIVLDGTVDLNIGCQDDPDDTSVIALYPDNFWGEHHFLGQTEVTCSVVATTESLILGIPFSILTPLAKKYSSLLDILKKECKRRCFYPFLNRNALFNGLTTSEKHHISEYLSTVHVNKGCKIIQEGECDESLYLIKSGKVEVYTAIVEREELQVLQTQQNYIPLATLETGDFFGEGAFFTHEPRSATISALTDVQLLKLPTRHIKAVIKNYPNVEKILRQHHEQRMADTMHTLQKFL